MSKMAQEKHEPAITSTTKGETEQASLFARHSPSLPGRIAFWASFVGFLAGLGGFIALTIQGAQSLDLGITAGIWLASALLLVTRFRWAPLVNILLSGYLLYRIFSEPYVFASLSNPYGPDGGIGKFIGTVITSVLAILVFGNSIGATFQNYRPGNRLIRSLVPLSLGLAAGMLIGALFIGIISQRPVSAGATTNGVPTVHMTATNFSQSSITISKGSSLVLVDDTSVEHDLFNGSWQNGSPMVAQEPGAPTLKNVQVSGNSVTIGPFSTAGTFHIFCTVHQGMNLTIIVQ